MAYEVVVTTQTGTVVLRPACVRTWAAAAGVAITGVETSPRRRAELHGHPKLAGLMGPAWGGSRPTGEPVIRYEDAAAYAALSM